MSDDFRSDPMPSAEGHGRARSRFDQAWEAYVNAVTPAVEPAGRWVAGRAIQDLLGFWLIWHLHGGFEGVQKLGMSRSAIYRRIKLFRRMFGEHPDDYELPGVTLDVEDYLRGPIRPADDS